jgi:penicillin-binding protein 1C
VNAAWIRWKRRLLFAARAIALAVLVPSTIVVQAAIVTVLFVPFDPAELAPGGTPLRIVDRRGATLAVIPGTIPDRDHWVSLADVPAAAVSAVIESEDDGFWDHRGVDGRGVARAIALDIKHRRLGYGGSTITMQLARLLLGTENHRSVWNKARETLLALRIERAVGKREILEQWFNRAYYGSGAYGIDAAARRYFGKPVTALSTGEAVFLAILPRAPTAYDPHRRAPAAIARRDRVIDMLARRGILDGGEAARAKAQPLAIGNHRPPDEAPHFVRWVVDQLPPDVRRTGGVVRTSLDLELQRLVERRLREHVATLDDRNVDQAGAVVLDTATSQVLAMVGSVDWDDPDAGQVNIAIRRRNPGSALKPFVYAAAIERGDAPTSIAYDVRDASSQYFTTRVDAEHGPTRYRMALAGSYNFAAIDVLERAGVERVMSVLQAAGVAELDGVPDDYGLRLALGAAKVRLVDLTAGYGFLVRGGAVRPATAIVDVRLAGGGRWLPAPVRDRRVFSPATAWMTMDMLADAEARHATFGPELPFDLPFPVAAKTGTARGFADMWAVAATREVIVGAWAGNFDGTPGQGVVAMRAAAPIVRDAMLAVSAATLDGRALTLPSRPDDVVAIDACAVSGMAPGPNCPRVHDVDHRHHAGDHETCTWHDDRGALRWPARAADWARRTQPPSIAAGER